MHILKPHIEKLQPNWLDSYGHLNEAYYIVAFSNATWPLQNYFGIGDIYFKSTGNTPLIFDECNFKLNPTDDTLVIFPSYLKHSVPPHNDKEDRICLAGNVWWELKQNKEWNNKT